MSALPLAARGRQQARIALPYWLREFALIRGAVLTAAACVLLCAAGIGYTDWLQEQARERMLLVHHARERAYARHAQVEQEKADIRRLQPAFQLLRANGLVGEENRLAWADAIRQAQQGLRMPALSYDIDAQQPLRPDTPVELGDYQLRASRMSLHLSLLHELELFNFLRELRLHGYYTVQDCALKRLAAAPSPGAPSLGADCTLVWVTLAPGAPEGSRP
ncbi:hypothetical protein ACLB1G_06365 [Oxalobacteraceae bacterium A2-2]